MGDNKYHGISNDSVVVLVVRKGSPEGVASFDDLLSKDVDIITPNPATSGSVRWNSMAVYGSQIGEGRFGDLPVPERDSRSATAP